MNKKRKKRFHRPEGFILVLPEKNQDSWRILVHFINKVNFINKVVKIVDD